VRAAKTFHFFARISAPYLNPRSSIQQMLKIYNPREAGMTIKFADGTHIEIEATAFDGFVKHDLKWAEFVHGRATVKKLTCKESAYKSTSSSTDTRHRNVHPCPAGGC
jgi:hypothetical protein